jgi:hypothetical protein
LLIHVVRIRKISFRKKHVRTTFLIIIYITLAGRSSLKSVFYLIYGILSFLWRLRGILSNPPIVKINA